MAIRVEVEKALKLKRGLVKDQEFRKLADFYEEMRKEGFVLKKHYELPPLDTIGHEFYKEALSKSSQG